MSELLNGAIHAVVFDLGGVLCGFDPARRLAAISDATGLAPEEIQARIWDSGFDGECDAGRHSLDQILQEIPRRLGVQLSPEEVTALYFTAFPEDEPVLALVDRLGPDVGRSILTNNGPLIRHGLPVHAPGVVARFPKDICLASDFDDVKPSRQVYDGMAVHLGLAPEALLFIDDSAKNVEGAEAAGWQVYYFKGVAGLERALEEAKVLS